MFTDHDPKFKLHDSTLAHEGQPAFIPRGPLFKRNVSPFTVPQSVFMPPSIPGLSKDDDKPILPPSMMVTYTEQEQGILINPAFAVVLSTVSFVVTNLSFIRFFFWLLLV